MKNLTWQNPEQLFVAQELINKVKSKCCGIKDINIFVCFFTLPLVFILMSLVFNITPVLCVRRYKHNYSKNIVPFLEYVKTIDKRHSIFMISIMFNGKVFFNINITNKELTSQNLGCFICMLVPCATTPLVPEDIPKCGFGRFVDEICTCQTYPCGFPFLPNKEINATISGHSLFIEVVDNLDKSFFGFFKNSFLFELKDEFVHRGASHIAEPLHYLLPYHLRLDFNIAIRLFVRSITFARGAVDEMREHSLLEDSDYIFQLIFSTTDFVAEITFVFLTPLIRLYALPFVGKCNKSIISSGNTEMTSSVALCLGNQLACLGVSNIAKRRYLGRGRGENLGIHIRHPYGNIKGICFVISVSATKIFDEILNYEVICPFTYYHDNYKSLFKSKNKTLTPSAAWHKGFYIMFGLRLHDMSKTSHLSRLVLMQRYNKNLYINLKVFVCKLCIVKIIHNLPCDYVYTFLTKIFYNMKYCRKSAAIGFSNLHQVTDYQPLKYVHPQFPVLKVVGLNPTGVTNLQVIENQLITNILSRYFKHPP